MVVEKWKQNKTITCPFKAGAALLFNTDSIMVYVIIWSCYDPPVDSLRPLHKWIFRACSKGRSSALAANMDLLGAVNSKENILRARAQNKFSLYIKRIKEKKTRSVLGHTRSKEGFCAPERRKKYLSLHKEEDLFCVWACWLQRILCNAFNNKI